MGSIVSLISGPPSTPEPEIPRLPPPVAEEETGTDENRRKRAEERRRALAMAGDGSASTIKTTPLGSTTQPLLAKSGLTLADPTAFAASRLRKSTLG